MGFDSSSFDAESFDGVIEDVVAPVVQTYGPFWSDRFWAIGFWSDEFWGKSWGDIEVYEPLRPRTHPNLKFTGIHEGRATVRGSAVTCQIGHISSRGSDNSPRLTSRQVFVGAACSVGTVNVVGRGGARSSVSGVGSEIQGGAVVARGAGRRRIQVPSIRATSKGVSCTGVARAKITTEDVFAFFQPPLARGIQNPTDEQMAHIAFLLTRRR